jgi:DNA-binding PucR family transcriptional regulator
MVQNAPEPWPTISPALAELIRRGADRALDARAEWLDNLQDAALSGERMRPIAEDPVLAEAIRKSNVASIRHWAVSNLERPGQRVPANIGPEIIAASRDMVRRGLDESALDTYRIAQGVVWRRWMEIAFELTSDVRELRELLDITALSVATYIEDTIAAVSETVQGELDDLTAGTHAERRATVALLLEGAPIRTDQAETQLGYRLTGPHTAAIVWGTSTSEAAQLEAAGELLVKSVGAHGRLTVVASAAALWLWLPTEAMLDAQRLAADLATLPDVRIALGRPGSGVDGFRRSHLDAVETQRMLARLTSPRQLASYQDIQLVALLTTDPNRTEEFLDDTLGALRHADAEVREVVLTYVHELGSTTRTAERLYTHRNTVIRRLGRADELLPRPLAENALDVAAALEALKWQDGG